MSCFVLDRVYRIPKERQAAVDLTGQMLKQLRREKEAIDTTIAALEDLLRKQDQASRRGKDQPQVGQINRRRTAEKQRLR